MRKDIENNNNNNTKNCKKKEKTNVNQNIEITDIKMDNNNSLTIKKETEDVTIRSMVSNMINPPSSHNTQIFSNKSDVSMIEMTDMRTKDKQSM